MKLRYEGINALLRTIGEIPLTDAVDYSLSDEAVQAETQINATVDSVLSTGFKFNRFSTKLIPGVDGFVPVPRNALVLEFKDTNLSINNGLVFDRSTYTSIFTSDVEVTITYHEDFDSCPIPIQGYIIAQASLVFHRDTINDPTKTAELERTEQKAMRELNMYRIRQAKANAKDARFSRSSNPVN